MSYPSYPVNDVNAVKLWSKGVTVAMREKCEVNALIGKDANAIIQLKSETSKGKGDNIKFNLRTVLNGDGFTEGQRAQGNGEGLSYFQDAVTINELGHVASPTSEHTIDAQRVPFEPRDEGRDALSEWWANRLSVTFFAHVCGYLPYNNAPYGVKYTGHNTITAPSTGRKVWATASVTNDQGLGSSDKFNLNAIDRALTAAAVGDNQMRPTRVNGQPKFVVYVHPQQSEDMQTNASTGQWYSIQQAALQGGQITKNGIYTGALGEYKNCIIRQAQHVTPGTNSGTGASVANTRRAVLLGAQAGCYAHGMKGSVAEQKLRWTEKYDDHDRLFEMGAWGIVGMKKATFNSVDQGVITMSSYSAL